jgi:hypothetical protein
MKSMLPAIVAASLTLALPLQAQTWTLSGTNIYPTPNGSTQRTVSVGTTSVGTGQKLRVTGVAEFDTVRAQKRIVAYGANISSRLEPDKIIVRNAADSTEITPASIKTKTIYVGTTGWSFTAPDYVFDKSYNLMPLSEVKKYVDKNGHLPDVPSAAAMEKSGSVNIVEMNMTLLKKIEELTLHSIAQEKRIAELEKKLSN